MEVIVLHIRGSSVYVVTTVLQWKWSCYTPGGVVCMWSQLCYNGSDRVTHQGELFVCGHNCATIEVRVLHTRGSSVYVVTTVLQWKWSCYTPGGLVCMWSQLCLPGRGGSVRHWGRGVVCVITTDHKTSCRYCMMALSGFWALSSKTWLWCHSMSARGLVESVEQPLMAVCWHYGSDGSIWHQGE